MENVVMLAVAYDMVSKHDDTRHVKMFVGLKDPEPKIMQRSLSFT